jgi:hypothetical protein
LALVATPQAAWAFDAELLTTIQLQREALPQDLVFSQLRYPSLTSTTSAERTSILLHVLAEVRDRPVDSLGLRLGIDSGLLELDLIDGEVRADGRDLGERAKQTFFLGETSADLQLGETGVVEIRAGKLRPRVGSGAIFDAYAFGASIDANLTLLEDPIPAAIRLDVLLPDGTFTEAQKDSPLLALSAGYESPSLKVRGLGAIYFDGGNGLAPVLASAYARGRFAAFKANLQAGVDRIAQPRIRQAVQREADAVIARAGALYNAGMIDYDIDTNGRLFYAGFEGSYRQRPVAIDATLVWARGQFDVGAKPNQAFAEELTRLETQYPRLRDLIARNTDQGELKIAGLFAQLVVRVEILESLEASAFGIYLSGDRGLRTGDDGDRTYDAFVSIAPLLTHTMVFFNGALSSSLAAPTTTTPAPDGAGVYGGGLGASYRPLDTFGTRVALASLWSPVGSATDASHYGVELDVGADLAIGSSWLLTADFGVFDAGSYFGDQPIGYQLLIGMAFGIGTD